MSQRIDGVGGGISGVSSAELESFFFDEAELRVRSGAGGEGAIAYVDGRRPAGGSGGAGGAVYLECSSDYNNLGHLVSRPGIRAGRGADADCWRSGAAGESVTICIPPNCMVVDAQTNVTLGPPLAPGARLLVAAGGQGGQGNGVVWKRTRRDGAKRVPPGGTVRAHLRLSMTLVADVGLVGLPNAGKSTLLRAVTRARPAVADYAFTTLIPNLGVTEMGRFGLGRASSMVWLDIPGLIEGAAAGKGLGHAFLRHTERCRLLLHLVDGESDDPARDLRVINKELAAYSPKLAAAPQCVVLTKTDLPHVAEDLDARLASLRAAARHGRVLAISAASSAGGGAAQEERARLRKLLSKTRSALDQMEARRSERRESRV